LITIKRIGSAFPAATRMAAGRSRLSNFRNDSNQGGTCRLTHYGKMWKPILSAPFDRDLELAVLNEDGEHALVFPCIRGREGWKSAATGARIDIHPTHWRDWESEGLPATGNKPVGDFP
jgi:hypothetical protein